MATKKSQKVDKGLSMMQKIMLSMMVIAIFMNHGYIFCANPHPIEQKQEISRTESSGKKNRHISGRGKTKASEIAQEQHAALQDLAYMTKKLDRDDLDLLWAQSLRPVSLFSIADVYAIQFNSPCDQTPSAKCIPIKIGYNAQGDGNILQHGVNMMFPDNSSHLLVGHPQRVINHAHHPSRNILVTGSVDGTIIIWNVKTQKIMAQFKNQAPADYSLHSIYFSLDGSMLEFTSHKQQGNVAYAVDSYYASPFKILTYDQTILLSMMQKMFKEKHQVDLCQLARQYKKDFAVLRDIFNSFEPEAQKILKDKYAISGDNTKKCVVQ